jgi:hypothetical protein
MQAAYVDDLILKLQKYGLRGAKWILLQEVVDMMTEDAFVNRETKLWELQKSIPVPTKSRCIQQARHVWKS